MEYKKGGFFMKNTAIRWLLTIKANNSLDISKNEIHRNAPINRFLDRLGYFPFNFITVNNKRFLIVFENEEANTKKSKLLVSKIHDTEERIIDMSDDDYEEVLKIAKDQMDIDSYKS